MASGTAYGDERRLPLRPPGLLLLGPIELALLVVIVGLATAPLLLADRRWVAGAVAALLGLPLAVVAARALHGLSRRWVVFVPAGLVLHDPLTLVDPVLFRQHVVARLAPARAGTDALDLTQRALGLALELELVEAVPMVLVRPGRREDEPGRATRLVFTPTRPGRVLDEAARRRLPVG
jgi:hypothetical protein